MRDLTLLNRLIRVINATQRDHGELTEVVDRQRNGTAYHVREFPPAASRPPECYVLYPDGTFAFSNSESMIHAVIDRKGRGRDRSDTRKAITNVDSGLGDQARLTAVQRQLPGPALVRMFVDPRHLERVLTAQPRPSKRTDARVMATLERYIAAVDYAGAALTWNDESIVIHTVETLNPSLLDPWLRHWAADSRQLDPKFLPVPPRSGHRHWPTRCPELIGRNYADCRRRRPPQACQSRKLVDGPIAGPRLAYQGIAEARTGRPRVF